MSLNKTIILILVLVIVMQSYFLFENYANSKSLTSLGLIKNAIFGEDEADVMVEALGLKVRQATNELSEEKFEDIIEELEEFQEKNPEEYLTYQNLGIAQYRKAYFFNDIELYSKAIESLNKAIELNPNDHVSHTWHSSSRDCPVLKSDVLGPVPQPANRSLNGWNCRFLSLAGRDCPEYSRTVKRAQSRRR